MKSTNHAAHHYQVSPPSLYRHFQTQIVHWEICSQTPLFNLLLLLWHRWQRHSVTFSVMCIYAQYQWRNTIHYKINILWSQHHI